MMMDVEQSLECIAGETKYSVKTCPTAALSITNPTRTDLGSNPGQRGGKPSSNCLSYGTTLVKLKILIKNSGGIYIFLNASSYMQNMVC